jgi:hypothetical protein
MRYRILQLLAVGLTVVSSRAQAQGTSERGVLYLRTSGKDTVVIDRYIRSRDTLQGIVTLKGQALNQQLRLEYVALLGPGETVRSINVNVFAAGGGKADGPVSHIHADMQGDSAITDAGAGVKRFGGAAGAIPMFNNALALTELFTRRAATLGGNASVPYFALNAGATLPFIVKRIDGDSVTATISGQVERFKVDASGRILGGTIAGTPLEYLRGNAADAATAFALATASAKPDYSAPAGAPYTAEEVSINGPGGKLGGTLTRPTNAKAPYPTVVTITGSGQEDRDEYIPIAGGIRLFRAVADTLSRRGIAVLRLDDRGKGASGGDYAASTSADFADDIRAALAWLRTRPDIDASRLALLGHSEGGMIAPMIAATDPKLKAIVLMAGPADKGMAISLAQNKVAIDAAPNLTQHQRDSIYQTAVDTLAKTARGPVTWLSFWLNYDPILTARKVKTPVLILQGLTDTQVSPDQAVKLEAAFHEAGNTAVTRIMLPNRDHLWVDDPDGNFNNYAKLKSTVIPKDVLGAVADWLVKTLNAKTTGK